MASTFKSIENTALLVMAAGKVPLIVGSAGQGKSSMAKNIASKLGAYYVNIDVNLLKEGEIGGLPLPIKRTRVDQETGETKNYTVTEYAIHCKLKEIQDYLDSNPEGRVLLFFDELNRAEKSVMSELMNLILNREINGFHLDKRIFMMAAMNPSGTTEGYQGSSEYAVTEMDAASKNRVIWLYMKLDPSSWLDWATDKSDAIRTVEPLNIHLYDPKEYRTNIHEDVVEFIAMNSAMLSIPSENQDVFASPRSYSFVSDLIRTYEKNRNIFDDTDLTTAIYGTIGISTGTSFMQFLSNNSNPLMKPQELWGKANSKEISEELLMKFAKDTITRKNIMIKSVIDFVSARQEDREENGKKIKGKLTDVDVHKLCQLLECLPVDNQIVIMRLIKNDHLDMHKKLLDKKEYITVFMKSNEAAGA